MSDGDGPLFIGKHGNSVEVTAEIAGSKAAQLWQMARLGLEVPPCFVLPTTLCAAVNRDDHAAIAALRHGLANGIAWLEQVTGRRFGDSRSPLLVSVRSGAAVSMPGMLQSVLNIGLNDDTVHGLIRLSGNPRLGFDSYRRMIQGYAEVVQHVPGAAFEQCLDGMIEREGVACENDLDPEALERLGAAFRDLAAGIAGKPVPDDAEEQLAAAADAVYRSWESARARAYRTLNRLDGASGTAVTVQAMVFGNAGPDSGAGVAFSRNPASGAKELYLDFLFDAQGEDVVSGRRLAGGAARLEARLPQIARQLAEGAQLLEANLGDVQDVEFTVEAGHLYFLQTRSAKRTPRAALRIAIDMVHEGLIDVATALRRLGEIDGDSLTITRFAEEARPEASAIAASPGVASGRVAFDPVRARELASGGEPIILVRRDISTDDMAGLAACAGILTAMGGRTAHAAVVARQLGKVCLVGCRQLSIDEHRRRAAIGDRRVVEGDWLSLDGDSGEVSIGRRAIVSEPPPELSEFLRWRAEARSAGG